jgi:hypothetical protein
MSIPAHGFFFQGRRRHRKEIFGNLSALSMALEALRHDRRRGESVLRIGVSEHLQWRHINGAVQYCDAIGTDDEWIDLGNDFATTSE